MGLFTTIHRVHVLGPYEFQHEYEGYLLELLVDTRKERIYYVEGEVGHLRTAALLLGIHPEMVCTQNAGHLVSALLKTQGKKIEQVLIGKSSLEFSHKVVHTQEQIAIAQLLVKRLIHFSMQLDHNLAA